MTTIYADHNATCPMEPAHVDKVADLLKRVDGNPSSIHGTGRNAKVAIEEARDRVAGVFGAPSREIVFTSGATEANNLAIQGILSGCRGDNKLPHVILGVTEHPSVIEPVKLFAERGLCTFDFAPVDRSGRIVVDQLLSLIRGETRLVCVMAANNETGAINDVAQIAERVKGANSEIHFHVDAVQIIGKQNLRSFADSKIDSASVSSHKLGGFKGSGALLLRGGKKLSPLMTGGGQERARRPGTENIPGILSFGLICADLDKWAAEFETTTKEMAVAFCEGLSSLPGAVLHSDPTEGLSNTVNFHIEGVPGDDIILNFDLAGIEVSSGSACSSGVGRPSHVLTAMGYSDVDALNSIRVSFSARGSIGDVERMLTVLEEVVKRRRPDAGKGAGTH